MMVDFLFYNTRSISSSTPAKSNLHASLRSASSSRNRHENRARVVARRQQRAVHVDGGLFVPTYPDSPSSNSKTSSNTKVLPSRTGLLRQLQTVHDKLLETVAELEEVHGGTVLSKEQPQQHPTTTSNGKLANHQREFV
jgi:hypothetical protein